MNPVELISYFSGHFDEVTTRLWLQNAFFPELLSRFNQEQHRRQFALYSGERIPSNERNLTDVRTRLGTQIEFEIARIANDILEEEGIFGIFWTHVVANRFPDLEVRNSNGDRLLRIEMKTLELIAEEKSANFDTSIKDIHAHNDYVVVVTWEWQTAGTAETNWDSAPYLFNAYVFHAFSLAKIRDDYWLNHPSGNEGEGFQGFDLRNAVSCNAGQYTKESGNLGKLDRIWSAESTLHIPETPLLKSTIDSFLTFREEIIVFGFDQIIQKYEKELTSEGCIISIEDAGLPQAHGYLCGSVAFVLKKNIGCSLSELMSFAKKEGAKILVTMTEKYRASAYNVLDESAICKSEKPKNLLK